MCFLGTNYFYHLARPLVLSEYFGFSLDNPNIEETRGILLEDVKDKVIVRYNMTEQMKDAKKKGTPHEPNFLLGYLSEKREGLLRDFLYFMSLLVSPDEWITWSIGTEDSIGATYRTKQSSVDDETQITEDFPLLWVSLEGRVGLIDKLIAENSENADKFLYIGNGLRAADMGNEYSALVRLVGILEMLLTHSGNGDDSITKQFKKKLATLIYQRNPQSYLNKITEKLGHIYDQRCNVAHGNFRKLYESEKKERVEDIVIELYQYVKIVLEAYLKDPQGITDLKDKKAFEI